MTITRRIRRLPTATLHTHYRLVDNWFGEWHYHPRPLIHRPRHLAGAR